MSISNNKRQQRKKASFALSVGLSVFLIAPMLLAGNDFVFIGSTTRQMTSAYAQEANNATTVAPIPSTTNSTDSNKSLSIQLSPQPVLQERTTTLSQTPINQTHISATFIGNGTLTIPNTAETINFTTNGSALISLVTHSTQAKETITTEQGETATATFYEILKINPAEDGDGKGLTMAVIQTDSTGKLAPLNGTILAGISDLQSNVDNTVTLWEWESGIDNNVGDVPSTQ
jgi:cytoskeletal protein RodZ